MGLVGFVLRPPLALAEYALPLLAGFLPILSDRRRRTFQDFVARSVVVRAP